MSKEPVDPPFATYWVSAGHIAPGFPDPAFALREPNGLLAAGGDLTADCLLAAYRNGIFPWYESNQPILWWSPDPRSVLFLERLKISRSLRKTLRKAVFRVTYDQAFEQVIRACAGSRGSGHGTWLTPAMIDAYCHLHQERIAHSVECWQDDKLVGGLYGVSLGTVFFGESMFSWVTDASKVALCCLVDWLTAWQFSLIDCQVHSPHLASLGAEQIPRPEFLNLVHTGCSRPASADAWSQS